MILPNAATFAPNRWPGFSWWQAVSRRLRANNWRNSYRWAGKLMKRTLWRISKKTLNTSLWVVAACVVAGLGRVKREKTFEHQHRRLQHLRRNPILFLIHLGVRTLHLSKIRMVPRAPSARSLLRRHQILRRRHRILRY